MVDKSFPPCTPARVAELLIAADIPPDGPFYRVRTDAFDYCVEDALPARLPRYIGIIKIQSHEHPEGQAYMLFPTPDRLILDIQHASLKKDHNPFSDASVEWLGYMDLHEERFFGPRAQAYENGRDKDPEPVEAKPVVAVKKGGRVKR